MQSYPVVLATLTAALLSLAPSDPAAPRAAPPGPGGVVQAVSEFLAAVDAGDAEAVAARLGAAPPGVGFAVTGAGQLEPVADAPYAAFVDVSAAGRPVAAPDIAAFRAAVLPAVRGGGGLELVRTAIRAIHADCPSGRCSWAVVDLERVYRAEDGAEVARPLRATALLEHRDDGFAVFHWHASRTEPAAAGQR